jgi:hypothetical protein
MPPETKRNKRPAPTSATSDDDEVNLIEIPTIADQLERLCRQSETQIKLSNRESEIQQALTSTLIETITEMAPTIIDGVVDELSKALTFFHGKAQSSMDALETKLRTSPPHQQPMEHPDTTAAINAITAKLEQAEQRLIHMQATIDSLTTELANRPPSTPTPAPPPATATPAPRPEGPGPERSPTWSEVVSRKGKKTTATTTNPKPSKKERTIVVRRQPTRTTPLDSLRIRDTINAELGKSNAPSHLRVAVATTNQNNSIVLTTKEDCPADTLLEFRATILNAIAAVDGTPTTIETSRTWFKIMVHGIDTRRYSDDDAGMTALQKEIESHTTLRLAAPPRYATRPESRLGTTASSVVICLTSAGDASNILKHRIAIDGTLHRTERFWAAKPTNRCHLCQRYGHHHKRCSHPPRCRLCAGYHPTTDHKCSQCPSLKGKHCAHVIARCSNCDGTHMASDTICPHRPKAAGADLGEERGIEGEEMEM